MYLEKSNTVTSAETFVDCKDFKTYLDNLIDLYSVVEVASQYVLTLRQRDFLSCTVIAVSSGYLDPISPHALQIYKKHFSSTIKKSDISSYIGKLRKKKWLQYNTEKRELKLPPILNDISPKEGTMDFRIRLVFDNNNDEDN